MDLSPLCVFFLCAYFSDNWDYRPKQHKNQGVIFENNSLQSHLVMYYFGILVQWPSSINITILDRCWFLVLQITKPTVLQKNYLLIHAAIYATSGIFIFVKIKKAIWKWVGPKLEGSPVVRYIQHLDLICAPLLLLLWICMAVDCFCYQ